MFQRRMIFWIVVVSLLCVAMPKGFAQDAGEVKLPETAVLAIRGRKGDTFKYQTETRSNMSLRVGELGETLGSEEILKRNYSMTYMGSSKPGTHTIQEKFAATSTLVKANGKEQKRPYPAGSATITLKSNYQLIKYVGKGSADQDTTSHLMRVMPTKPLSPGDSWKVMFPLKFSKTASGKIMLNVEARLAGFEMYQGFMAARVEYTFKYNGPIKAISEQILRSLPKGSKATTIGNITGNATSYYSLDRCMILDEELRLNGQFNINITTENQKIEALGSLDVETRASVTQAPPFDPKLMPKQ